MNTSQVSIAIITRNEEKNIKDALDSVREFDEIIIVDSYSTDKTMEICKEYGTNIYQHEWEGYARQKQKAVDYASGPWVLILDADERLTPELKNEVTKKIADSRYDGYYIPRENYFMGKWIQHSGWWPDHTLRLFKKEVSHVEQREVHEKVIVNGSIGYMSSPIKHYSYRTISDFVQRMDTYSTLSAKEFIHKSMVSSFGSMLVSPVLVFFKMFFLRQGFRDGIHGYVLAMLYSFYTFLKYVKILERKGKLFG